MATRRDLERAALKLLSEGRYNVGRTFDIGEYSFRAALQEELDESVNPHDYMELMWGLVGAGLVFIDHDQPSPGNWSWWITERGKRLVESGTFDPDDPDGYLMKLVSAVPDIDGLIELYASEALRAYETKCYLATAVMLGVASERAFQVLGEAFQHWAALSEGERKNFTAVFTNPRQVYVAKFEELRRRLESHKDSIPGELADGLAVWLDGVLDLLRVNRNDAGHPTGRRIDEGTAYTTLQLFGRYVVKLYALRDFFLRP